MKYRIVKETDGFGVERTYAQVGREKLFYTDWKYLSSYKPNDFREGHYINETTNPGYSVEEFCTWDLALKYIEAHKKQMILQAKRDAPHKQEILRGNV